MATAGVDLPTAADTVTVQLSDTTGKLSNLYRLTWGLSWPKTSRKLNNFLILQNKKTIWFLYFFLCMHNFYEQAFGSTQIHSFIHHASKVNTEAISCCLVATTTRSVELWRRNRPINFTLTYWHWVHNIPVWIRTCDLSLGNVFYRLRCIIMLAISGTNGNNGDGTIRRCGHEREWESMEWIIKKMNTGSVKAGNFKTEQGADLMGARSFSFRPNEGRVTSRDMITDSGTEWKRPGKWESGLTESTYTNMQFF
jgi:hypothetical protein